MDHDDTGGSLKCVQKAYGHSVSCPPPQERPSLPDDVVSAHQGA